MPEFPKVGTVITTQSGMQYIIGPLINQGNYALIFEGMDIFGNPIVLKVLKPSVGSFESIKAQWEKECNNFILLRHPNVVAIYDFFAYKNLFYIVLERAWGNLYDWVQQIKPNEMGVREIARQLLFAIYFIHSHGVVQRDITIFNTLVFEGPQSRGPIFKISDFGISKSIFEPWQPSDMVAHPFFIPPELLSAQSGFNPQQSDLYHLGLILLFSLTGVIPFNEKMNMEQRKQYILDGGPRKEAEKIKTPFGTFISILLRRHQQYRFKTAIEAWNYLKTI